MMFQKITNYMVRNGIVSETQSELFMYALDDTFHQAKIVGTILCIGIILGYPMETMLFLLAFSFLRRYCGGIHAATPAYCFLSTVCLYGLALWATLFVDKFFLIIEAVMAVILIYHYAPIEHKNNILNLRQKQMFRRYSRCIVVILAGTAISAAMYMDSRAISMVLCTIILNGANIIVQTHLTYPKLRIKRPLLYAFAVCVFCIGTSSLQSACRNWSYQPEITASLRKHMDEGSWL